MAQLLSIVTSRVTCIYNILPTDEEIRERHLRHIAEISKHLSFEPIKSQKLNFEQEQWLKLRLRNPMGEPWKSWSRRLIK